MHKADIGLIGLAVMGENLARNIASKGFRVAVYNRTTQKVCDFLNRRAPEGVLGAYCVAELVKMLSRPRRVLIMVRAGAPVDQLVEELAGVLEPGDIILDGGNSNYQDTQRRVAYAEARGLYFIGMGVSGGEEGALRGPSIMPGGSLAAWPHVKPVLQAVSAQVDGEPCCDWVGAGGAGHFVKMAHNGIEYGDMQLIGEAYLLMRDVLGMTNAAMRDIFARWNAGVLHSYLMEITCDILAFRDQDGEAPIDHILDAAGQKGTGKWTGIAALEAGVPLTLIAEAVFARCLSAERDLRLAAAKTLGAAGSGERAPEAEAFLAQIHDALYAAKIVSYAQGFALLRAADTAYGWNLNFQAIARMWRGGCIIRSAFLDQIAAAYARCPALDNLLLDDYFARAVMAAQDGWRRVVAAAALRGVPIPATAAGLSYFDGLRQQRGCANLIQAQRDFFGAHTYERTDAPRGAFFHTNWTGAGGSTAAGAYNA